MSNLEHKNEIQNRDHPLSYKGRFSRLSYLAWNFIITILYSCALLLVIGVVAIAIASSGLSLGIEGLFSSSLGYFTIILLFVVIIVFLVLFLNLTIRRLHDLNKTGWLALLMLVPILNIGFWIYVTCFKGTQGSNNYGPARPTEQSEKYLGTIYAIFLGIFIFAYAAGIIAYQKYMNLNNIPGFEQNELNHKQMTSTNEETDEYGFEESDLHNNVVLEDENVQTSQNDAVSPAGNVANE